MPRHLLAVAALTLGAVAFPGCSACDPFSIPAEGEGEGEAPEDSPPLPTCQDDTGCDGGEHCVEHRCHASCDDNHPCDGAYDLCDSARGVCVACLGLSDCASTQICDVDNGACLTPACTADSQCEDGEVCDGYRCVIVNEGPCTALSERCEANTAVRCNADGTAETRETCAGADVCTETSVGGTTHASCLHQVCAPDSIGCIDDHAAYLCSADGQSQTEAPCRDDQVCRDGACLRQVCTPNSVTCAGNQLITCSADGLSSTATGCDDVADCADTPFGCACISDSCVERTCAPGAGRCVGNSAQVCSAQGTSFSSLSDCGADLCVQGQCLPDPCGAGDAAVCAGRDLVSCTTSDGTWHTTTCDGTCIAEGGAHCGNLLCTPNAQTCTSDGRAYTQCNGSGSDLTEVSCAIDEVCVSGACQPMACAPNSRTCNGDAVRVCNAAGTDQTLELCAGDAHCDAGHCVQDTCTPSCGARTCGPDPICGASCGPCVGNCSAAGTCELTSDDTVEIRLSWTPTTEDLDLYVSRNTAVDLCNADTCFWATCTQGTVPPDWDGTGTASPGDPLLDIVDAATANPEVVRFKLPGGTSGYRIAAHHFPPQGGGGASANAVINVFVNGALKANLSATVPVGEMWAGPRLTVSASGVGMQDDGLTIDNFQCSENPPASTACTSDASCNANEYCTQMVEFFPGAGGTCAVGCRTDASCDGDTVCSGDHTCVPASSIQPNGAACSAAGDCAVGMGCALLLNICAENCSSAGACADPESADCCPRTHGTCTELVPGFGFGYCTL